MMWPTLEQVASMTWEETRHWLNTLPGARSKEHIEIIRAICAKNVSYWPKRTATASPLELPPERPAPPPPKPKSTPKPCPPPKVNPPKPGADLDLFRNLFRK